MRSFARIAVAQTLRPALAARLTGEADHPKLLRALPDDEDALVLLDFSTVEVLTSSYWNAAIAPLWRLPRSLFPVIVEAPQVVADELAVICRNGFNCYVGALKGDQLLEPKLLGPIDGTLEVTLAAVRNAADGVTGAELVAFDETVAATAWNNRLAALAEKRLVRRRKEGRRVVYFTPWGGT